MAPTKTLQSLRHTVVKFQTQYQTTSRGPKVDMTSDGLGTPFLVVELFCHHILMCSESTKLASNRDNSPSYGECDPQKWDPMIFKREHYLSYLCRKRERARESGRERGLLLRR